MSGFAPSYGQSVIVIPTSQALAFAWHYGWGKLHSSRLDSFRTLLPELSIILEGFDIIIVIMWFWGQLMVIKGKSEHVSDFNTILNVGCSFHPCVHIHCTVMVEFMTQMGGMGYPRQVHTIQLQGSRVHRVLDFWSTHVEAFGLGLGRIDIS